MGLDFRIGAGSGRCGGARSLYSLVTSAIFKRVTSWRSANSEGEAQEKSKASVRLLEKW